MKALPTPRALFGDLPVAVYRIACRIAQDAESNFQRQSETPSDGLSHKGPSFRQSLYWGSAWRGLLGWELQRILCPYPRRPACKSCLIRRSCPYFRLMEDQSDELRIQEAPRGYVLYPTTHGDGNQMDLHITLFGECIRYAPVVFKALQNGEETGLGGSRTPYVLLGIQEQTPQGRLRDIPLDFDRCTDFGRGAPLAEWLSEPAPAGHTLTCRLVTPVRLRKNGKYLGRMDWDCFFATLIRRLESLGCLFASGGFLGKDRFLEILAGFCNLNPKTEDLRWHDYTRWSNRQRRKVPMGGLVGEARFDVENEALWDWFSAARLVHVGKGASMGLGKIEAITR